MSDKDEMTTLEVTTAECEFLLSVIARIRDVTGCDGVPLADLPDAIRQRMTMRPSKEAIHQMVTYREPK